MRKPKALILGILGSTALLTIFMVLQGREGSALAVPIPFLLTSLSPTMIGLVAGNYFRRAKIVGIIDFEMENLPEAPQHTSATTIAPNPSQWQLTRAQEYARTDGYMLSHVYRPSTDPDQDFEIYIFVVRHEKGTSTPPKRKFAEILKAEFFFGASWGNETFPVMNTGGVIGVQTHAWGTFLATCRVTFKEPNKQPIILHRYVDFAMAAKQTHSEE